MNVEKFRIARGERDMGINQLARVLGVSTTSVSKWQSGKSKPKPAMLIRIASALDVEPGYLDETFDVNRGHIQARVVADVLADARRELSGIMGLPESQIRLELTTHL
jgi:transcriptional regulator with XRE-family HTH domain